MVPEIQLIHNLYITGKYCIEQGELPGIHSNFQCPHVAPTLPQGCTGLVYSALGVKPSALSVQQSPGPHNTHDHHHYPAGYRQPHRVFVIARQPLFQNGNEQQGK